MHTKSRFLVLGALILSFVFQSCNESPTDPSGVDVEALKTAVVTELNLVRTQPAQYAGYLRNMRQYFNGKIYAPPGATPLQTQEGLAAVDEAIAFLDTVGVVSSLTSSDVLAKSAKDHVSDTGPKGIVGHTGSDGSSVQTRIDRYGKDWGLIGETIAYGNKTAHDIVIQLIIDDGVPDRGHRNIIFDNDFKIVGVGFGVHSVYNYMCVIDWADVIKPVVTLPSGIVQ